VVTSTWLRFFGELASVLDWQNEGIMDNVDELHKVVPKWFEKNLKGIKTMPKIKTFLEKEDIFILSFVRHPFDRLVSAFENKVSKYPT